MSMLYAMLSDLQMERGLRLKLRPTEAGSSGSGQGSHTRGEGQPSSKRAKPVTAGSGAFSRGQSDLDRTLALADIVRTWAASAVSITINELS